MLNIEQLSFWERKSFFENNDFLIVGGGIVGCSTAYHLKINYPKAKIVLLERGYLPSGASTKNAGFASFGGPVELIEDLKKQDAKLVWDTVQARYEGLVYLRELIGDKFLDFQQNGGWDLISPYQTNVADDVRNQLEYLNDEFVRITGNKGFQEDKSAIKRFGFSGLDTAFKINLEGQIDTGKMMQRFNQLLHVLGVVVLNGISVLAVDESNVTVKTSIGDIKSANIIITTNGFTSQLLKNIAVQPARAQVLVTSPIPDLKIKGTFHYDAGYYYFRNFENRILFGGARNLDFEGETTYEMVTTPKIQKRLKELLKTMIIPNTAFSIDYQWSGIMGLGESKYPIIEKISNHVAVGARLGGIGVALGTNVGKKVADLF
ncbi:MAG: FAD-binding oxidoreductase [Crocinitomicaceae bacterium]|nr:FAD-binding oxidoreductase [Crocinitomicaceae bacterium]